MGELSFGVFFVIAFVFSVYFVLGVGTTANIFSQLLSTDKARPTPFGWFCLVIFFPFAVFAGPILLISEILRILKKIELIKERGE